MKFRIGDLVRCECSASCGLTGNIVKIKAHEIDSIVLVKVTKPGKINIQIGEIDQLNIEHIKLVSKLEKALS